MAGDRDGTWVPGQTPGQGTWLDEPNGPADGALSPPPPSSQNHDVPVEERYALGAEVARGGLGRIVEAWDHQLDREVAVKQLLRPSPGAEARFDREMHLTARLQHPNIVPVFDGGRLAGVPYLAMRRVHGRSLADALDAAVGLDGRMRLLPHLIDVANALAYAHGQRVVHRDLKPDNVLVGDFGETVVIDWGLAKDLDADITEEVGPPGLSATEVSSRTPMISGRRSSSRSLTRVGSVMGTPRYMAPEQATGGVVDARSDVYALGAMLYELLAGQPPYADAEDPLASVREGPPVDVALLEPTAPKDLTSVVRRAMERDPLGRYDDAASFALDLSRFLEGRFVSAYDYTAVERVTRLVRQHPLVTGLLLLMIVGSMAFVAALERARSVAETERTEAARLEEAAVLREDQLRIDQARRLAEIDPAKAIELLGGLSERTPFDGRVRTIFSAAMAAGPGIRFTTKPGIRRPVAVLEDDSLVVALEEGGVDVRDIATGASRTHLLNQEVAEVLGLGPCVLVRARDGIFRVTDAGVETVWQGGAGIGTADDGLAAFAVSGGVVVLGCDGAARTVVDTKKNAFAFASEQRVVAVGTSGGIRVSMDDGPFAALGDPCPSHRWGFVLGGERLLSLGDASTVCATSVMGETEHWDVPGATWLEQISMDEAGGVFVAGGGHHVWHLDAQGRLLGDIDADGPVYALSAFPGGVWVGTSNGVLWWTGERQVRIPLHHAVRLVADLDGTHAAIALGDEVRVVSIDLAYHTLVGAKEGWEAAPDSGPSGPFILTAPVERLPRELIQCGGRWVHVDRDRTVRLDGEFWLPPLRQTTRMTCMEQEGILVMGRPGEAVNVYDMRTEGAPSLVASEPIEEGEVRAVSAPGTAVVVVGGKVVHWNGDELTSGPAPTDVSALSMASDGRGFLATREEAYSVRGTTLERVAPFSGRWSTSAVSEAALAVGTQSGTIDLRMRDGRAVTLLRHGRWVEALQFSKDGRFLLSGGWDEVAVLWDLSVWPPEGRTLRGHRDGVNKVTFVPDGLVTGGFDGRVLAWSDPWPRAPNALRRAVAEAADALASGRPVPPPPHGPPVVPVVPWSDLVPEATTTP